VGASEVEDQAGGGRRGFVLGCWDRTSAAMAAIPVGLIAAAEALRLSNRWGDSPAGTVRGGFDGAALSRDTASPLRQALQLLRSGMTEVILEKSCEVVSFPRSLCLFQCEDLAEFVGRGGWLGDAARGGDWRGECNGRASWWELVFVEEAVGLERALRGWCVGDFGWGSFAAGGDRQGASDCGTSAGLAFCEGGGVD